MKNPLSYYGGKQQLATKILGMIPEHRLYCEPFTGGGAVFFAKPPSAFTAADCMNRPGSSTKIRICSTRLNVRGRSWVRTNASFGGRLDGGFGYDLRGVYGTKLANKRACFTSAYAERMRQVQIESCDALRIIASRDNPDSFFYVDPPYVGADQGHYDGYSQADFDALLATLEGISGRFLLSSYRNASLTQFARRSGWQMIELKMHYSPMAARPGRKSVTKIEVLTANYPIEGGKVP